MLITTAAWCRVHTKSVLAAFFHLRTSYTADKFLFSSVPLSAPTVLLCSAFSTQCRYTQHPNMVSWKLMVTCLTFNTGRCAFMAREWYIYKLILFQKVIVDEVKLLSVHVWHCSEWDRHSLGATIVIAQLLWACVCVCPAAVFLWSAMNNGAWCSW